MKKKLIKILWMLTGKWIKLVRYPGNTVIPDEFTMDPERYIQIVDVKINEKRNLKFFGYGSVCHWRADTLLKKEPETIDWINKFEKDSVFWDIGANIGLYSLYAGVNCDGITVLAFEPLSSNYYILNKNISINNLAGNITAYSLAFSDKSSLGLLNISSGNPGDAMNEFGTETNEIVCGSIRADVKIRQGMIGYSIDEFVQNFHPLIPNYIKIDVDGIEDKIIEGALNTFSNPKVKSVLIEMDANETEYVDKVTKYLKKAGLVLKYKKHEDDYYPGEFASIYNYFYFRELP